MKLKSKRLLLLLIVLPIAVLAIMHTGQGYQWSDPDPTTDSLALEAQRKLGSLDGSCLAEGQTKTASRLPKRGNSRGAYIVVDTHTNHLYLRQDDRLLVSALCSTGTGAELIDTGDGRHWRFDTPKGFFRVDSKVDNPWWRKPDWAYIEEGEPLPQDDQERLDPRAMGDYALGFGDGYFIHGTILERLIGISVTHGCVRMRSDELKQVYDAVTIGTPVIIY